MLWEFSEKLVKTNPNAAILEVGVWRGGTSAIIAKQLFDINFNNKLYLADTFEGVVKTSEEDLFYQGMEHNETSVEIVTSLIKRVAPSVDFTILKGIFPDETENLIEPNTFFCLCHIDVDVYQSAKDIVNWIFPKLVKGGVIVFDDYGFHTCNGITNLVNELKNSPDRLIIHNLNGHAVMIKL